MNPGNPTAVAQAAYAAFGKGDVQAILDLLADKFEGKFVGSKGLAYTGTFTTKDDMAKWFANVAAVDDIEVFEPREFLAGEDSVTVLGYERTRDHNTKKVFETEWVHIFTVRNGKVVRFWGMYDTEASAQARR